MSARSESGKGLKGDPHEAANFGPPPPIKGRMERGFQNRTSTIDLSASIMAAQNCMVQFH
jgi:hypothetical protein